MSLPETTSVKVFDLPPRTTRGDFYIGNREPLEPSRLRKLPIGAVQPKGWIRKQLELQAGGFIGHLTEISPFLEKKNNAWLSPTGQGEHGWEEVPYWLKGFGDMAYLLGDPRLLQEASVWIEGVLGSQRADGYFGPEANRTANHGSPDMWPNMVMLNCLQSYYEWRQDPRVLDFMSRYFKWQLALPEDRFYLSYWEKHRGGDNLASVYWLYNRTGESWLLDLAHKIHRRTADWVGGVPDTHGVNFAQAFREPAEYWALSKDPAHLLATEADYQSMRNRFGQVPGGMYGADENVRPGFDDPRQAAETCAMVEMMLSDEMLLGLTGDRKWAERCEDVAFNSLPASMTSDLRCLRYLTAPNLAVSDKQSKSPGFQNGGPMLEMNPYEHRCCQHNVSHGWPYFAEHLWMAAHGNGLGVALYGPSEVKAQVGIGEDVHIVEETNYPFEDTVRFRFLEANSRFPLMLRLPSWSTSPQLSLNGKPLKLPAKGAWAVVERTWKSGDVLTIRMPMRVTTTRWAAHGGAVSINRGPLTYALDAGEQQRRSGGTDAWPAYEILPKGPWNYGIDPATAQVAPKKAKKNGRPWSPEAIPVALKVQGRRIPEWALDMHGLVSPLQVSPAFTKEPLQELELIPMGAARLRIAVFPTFATRDAHVWSKPQMPKESLPASASHVWGGDTVKALSDGLLPKFSNDLMIPRFTWWDHKGSTEWVQYDLVSPITASEASVYWFDDRDSNGGCRVPQSWRLLYVEGGTWREVAASDAYGTDRNRFNRLRFKAATSAQWRIEVVLQEGFSAGILEWILK